MEKVTLIMLREKAQEIIHNGKRKQLKTLLDNYKKPNIVSLDESEYDDFYKSMQLINIKSVTFVEALRQVICTHTNAANIPTLLVETQEAAEIISAHVNASGGLGSITGPFEEYMKQEDTEPTAYFAVDLRTTAESISEVPAVKSL